MTVHALRLKPGADLKSSLEALLREKNIRAAAVLACVGSLSRVALRFANKDEITLLDGKYEIVSLQATLSVNGCHLHMSVSDGAGKVVGGHVKEGCIVFTTAEVVIGEIPGIDFLREKDQATGYPELVIKRDGNAP
jgi:predicted DNA-binding protein with PD1-like motif